MRVRKDTVILDRRFVPKGAVIIKEGEFGNQAFLVQSGAVRVFVKSDDREVELAKLGTGQIFGEMALIFDGPRTASVQASEDCNLIVISRQQFEDKLRSTDPTIKAVVNMMARRILDVNNSLINKKNDLDALKEATRVIYQNVAGGLKGAQLRAFQSGVVPKIEGMLEALEAFEDRYGDADTAEE